MYGIATGWIWLGFCLFVILALSVDTFFLDKKVARPHQSMRAALIWTTVWVSLALLFNVLLWLYLCYSTNPQVAYEVSMDFLAGYVIEKSLSIDNLFVFYLIFEQMRIPLVLQQRIFMIGIWSAIVMRLLLIFLFTFLVLEMHWLLYVMGLFLLLTGIKMLMTQSNKKSKTVSNIIRWLRRYLRMTDELHGNHFIIRKNGLRYVTPLLLALILIEISDIIFAFDSIPAIFAITQDPFIVWSANIFALLGLRALYFLLAGMVHRFKLLKYGIAIILMFVGFKLVMAPWITISVGVSLGIIASILLLFTILSVWQKK